MRDSWSTSTFSPFIFDTQRNQILNPAAYQAAAMMKTHRMGPVRDGSAATTHTAASCMAKDRRCCDDATRQ